MDINLKSLSTSMGFRIFGGNIGDGSGCSVSSAGDINHDGYADIIIGASQYPSGAGESYVIFGKANGFEDINLSNLIMPDGFKIIGENSGDHSGVSVSSAGDINGDGYADIIIGAPNALSGAGKSYVIFGKANGFSDINLNTLSMPAGFNIIGENANDISGYSISSAGDINGDGFADIIIGAPWAAGYAGKTYLIFGKASGFSNINLNALSIPTGFKIIGESAYNYNGFSVSNAGDVNGDGFADIIIGAFGHATSYIIFGKDTKFSDINLSTLSASIGFKIIGEANSYCGYSVSGAGDINDDGFADIIIGAYNTGKSYVVFGKSTGFNDIDLSTLSMPEGFKILGESISDNSGFSVSRIGDINKDGYDDIIIGAPNASNNTGKSYVIFGKANGFSDIDLSSLDIPVGFRIIGEATNDHSGWSVSGLGDISGDGHAGIVIGANQLNSVGPNGAGKSYVLFGNNMDYFSSSTGGASGSNIIDNPGTSTLDSFIKYGVPIISAVAGVVTIIGALYTLAKCHTDKVWCFAAQGCWQYTKDWLQGLCANTNNIAAVSGMLLPVRAEAKPVDEQTSDYHTGNNHILHEHLETYSSD